MSHVLTIDGRDYIPAGRVGKHFGYTRDYILTLAREGKIDGKKVGHRWYVNLESAEQFFESARVMREERKHQIREERKSEFHTYQIKNDVVQKSSRRLEVVAIVLVVLVFGMVGYATNSVNLRAQAALTYASDAPFFEKLAVTIYNFISPEPEVVVVDVIEYVPPVSNDTESDSSLADGEHATRTTRTSIVVGPGEVLTTTNLEAISESFSDDVSISIDPHNPDAGIIIPHFKDGDGEEYRYLIVPITKEDNS